VTCSTWSNNKTKPR